MDRSGWYTSKDPVCLSERPSTCDALLSISHTLQSALESGHEARIVQINFSAAFHMDNHQGIIENLCSVGSVLSILTEFLSNRT